MPRARVPDSAKLREDAQLVRDALLRVTNYQWTQREAFAALDRLLAASEETQRRELLASDQLAAVDKALNPWEPEPGSTTGVVGRVQMILNLKADRVVLAEARAALQLARSLAEHMLNFANEAPEELDGGDLGYSIGGLASEATDVLVAIKAAAAGETAPSDWREGDRCESCGHWWWEDGKWHSLTPKSVLGNPLAHTRDGACPSCAAAAREALADTTEGEE